MKRAIALCVAASAAFFTPASAQSVSIRSGGDSVILLPALCSDVVKKHIAEPQQPVFFRATAMVKGKPFEACWTIMGNEVLVIFDDGEYARFPAAAFKNEPGV